ncbi:hypothetical protein N7454_008667 [Penicillium verhagenii]|nr:hypothetical protein N7454_008667 [Penicillium verhagenii]
MSSVTGVEDHFEDAHSYLPDETQERADSQVRFELPTNKNPKSSRRIANVYDSVAGRVNINGFVSAAPTVTRYGDTQSSGGRNLRPEEALYRKKPKMLRKLKEDESYFANENLPADRPLPSSEILTAIHAYASDFYTHKLRDGGKHNFQSMDESALLAIGILMEELAREQLGDNGDMVLTQEPWPSEDEEEENDEDNEDHEDNDGEEDDQGEAEDDDDDDDTGLESGSQIRQKRRRSKTIEGPIQANPSVPNARKKEKRHRTKKTERKAIRKEKAAQRSESPQKKQKTNNGPA